MMNNNMRQPGVADLHDPTEQQDFNPLTDLIKIPVAIQDAVIGAYVQILCVGGGQAFGTLGGRFEIINEDEKGSYFVLVVIITSGNLVYFNEDEIFEVYEFVRKEQ